MVHKSEYKESLRDMTALFTSGMFYKKALILACPRAHCSVMPLAVSKTAWVWRPQGGLNLPMPRPCGFHHALRACDSVGVFWKKCPVSGFLLCKVTGLVCVSVFQELTPLTNFHVSGTYPWFYAAPTFLCLLHCNLGMEFRALHMHAG